MSNDAQQKTILLCEQCHGKGSKGIFQCTECGGMGKGIVYGGRFLFWGRRLDVFSLRLSTLRSIGNGFFTFLAIGIVVWGGTRAVLLVLVQGLSRVVTPAFWAQHHEGLGGFWIALLAILFLIYRGARVRERHQEVWKQAYHKDDLEPRAILSWKSVRALPRNARIDVSRAFSSDAIKMIYLALRFAKRLGHSEMRTSHLFSILLDARRVRLVFGRLGVAFESFQDELVRVVQGSAKGSELSLAHNVEQAFLEAYIEAVTQKQPNVDTIDLFVAVLREDKDLQEMLFVVDAPIATVENVVHWIRLRHQLQNRYRAFSSLAKRKPKTTMNRAMTALATPLLDKMSRDLTLAAARFDLEPVVGREKEISAIFRSLEGGGKSVVLVGPDGVGKDALIGAIAQRMVEEDVPKILRDKRLVSIDIGRIVSGVTASEAQERLLVALYEVGQAKNVVLVVPHVSAMTGMSSGEGEALDLSRVFANELSRGYFFAITTATDDEYGKGVEGTPLDGALVRIDVDEPDVNNAIRMLQAKTMVIEYQHKVTFSYRAVEAAVLLSDRYLHDAFLPEKAIEVAKEASNIAYQSRGSSAIVEKEDIAAVVSEKANIPLTQLTVDQSKRLLDLEKQLHSRVIGQDHAVRSVASAMRRAGASMRSEGRPIANFLFLGPTGVGKTELAKSLAEAYFGDESAMIRLDMSEYQDPSSLHRLLGNPGGERGGILTEAIRKTPFTILLLDEIEKADANILTVFLQVMDDGRLTDNSGRVIDFTNVIIIATSNAGAQYIQDAVREGLSTDVMREHLINEQLKSVFRPEFLNRFDESIVFTPITPEELLEITRLMLKKTTSRLEEKGIRFSITDDAVRELSEAGYDPAFGARPLRRVLQDRVDNALADLLLRGEAGRGDTIMYNVGGEVYVEKARR